MAVPLTPAQQAQKWAAGMQIGGTRWAQGCASTDKNLFALALEQSAQAQANYAKAVAAGGSWANAMAQGNMQEWKSKVNAAAGAGRFAQGGEKGKNKYAKFAAKAAPVYQAMRAAADGAQGPVAKVTAALNVLMAAGRKTGNNSLAANS